MQAAINRYGVRVRRCCASCAHRAILKDGSRVCQSMWLVVDQLFCCRQWRMRDGLMNAGKIYNDTN